MTSIPALARALQSTLLTVPAEVERATGYCRRVSKLSGAAFVQTLVFGWLAQPTASLQALCQVAADVGVAVSPQGLDHRFGPASAALLQAVLDAALERVVASEPVAVELLQRFPAVLLLDSTTITLPDPLAEVWVGCGGHWARTSRAALKATVRLDLVTGQLEGPVLSAGRAPDQTSPVQHWPLPAGAVRIGDLGFWRLDVLAEIRAQQAHFLSRLHVQTVIFRAGERTRLDLEGWLASHPDDQLECDVELGQHARIPARLLAIRVPAAVAETRRATIRADARRNHHAPSQRNLTRADWTLLVTSVPTAQLSVGEAEVLLRARWQIELLFKLWKSGGALATWRSRNPDRILCEVYAKLLAMIIQHWLLLTGGWQTPDRSLPRLAHTIRTHLVLLFGVLDRFRALTATLHRLAAALARLRPSERRRRRPSTAQLLQNPDLSRLA
jgi:hypothetical protein